MDKFKTGILSLVIVMLVAIVGISEISAGYVYAYADGQYKSKICSGDCYVKQLAGEWCGHHDADAYASTYFGNTDEDGFYDIADEGYSYAYVDDATDFPYAEARFWMDW